jgi:glutamate synthase domain-containing protein 2
MSYGALSNNAILALNTGAKLGQFYHNTGEGGLSRFHKEPGGDIVWNIGTGYFGCRNPDGSFSPERFKENALLPQVRMIEIKLSQGAKPGHGGILPGAKVTQYIAEARGVPVGQDCISPALHSAFNGPQGLIEFVQTLRELSGGKPVGFKLCVGHPEEIAAIVQAMVKLDITPDFITIDGGEGGTGAAPPEYSNHMGTPLVEGLTLVHNLLLGAGIRERIKIISAGKIISGFSLVKQLALGADLCNAARAMMFALGCIQALKCNTNKCPTGVATQDPELIKGLHVPSKAQRVFSYQKKTVESAMEIIGSIGLDHPINLERSHIYKRIDEHVVMSYAELHPEVPVGSLMNGTAPEALHKTWTKGLALLEKSETDLRAGVKPHFH